MGSSEGLQGRQHRLGRVQLAQGGHETADNWQARGEAADKGGRCDVGGLGHAESATASRQARLAEGELAAWGVRVELKGAGKGLAHLVVMKRGDAGQQ